MTEPAGASPSTGTTRTDSTPLWLAVTIAVFFGLFFAYDAWEAVGNLLGLNAAAGQLGTTLSGFGWGVLILGILLPILVFALAFWLGRRRRAGVQALLFFVGLCLSAVLSLDIFVMFGLGSLIA
ncbi:MAG: hypothetical protein JWQ59_290 [Cryobacterium sp.]|jgi:hypothetical protein|nr:hypothetical protein [Cryobacterium sp.]